MYHKTKVLLLQLKTETNCVIGKFVDTNQLIVRNDNDIPRGVPHHLYFLSDEEIKKGDWYYDFHNQEVCQSNFTKLPLEFGNCKKIIVTTDRSLSEQIMYYPDGAIIGDIESYKLLPQPSTSFIEHFVEEYNKGNIITEVEVEYEEGKYNLDELRERHLKGLLHSYDYCKLKINFDNTINIIESGNYHSPKEKAYELFNKYLSILGNIEKKDWVYFHGEQAKQCALIAVEEILNSIQVKITDKYLELGFINYWQQVKQEIEKI